MTDGILFILGSAITVVTVLAVLLVGRSEARDPTSNRPVNGVEPQRPPDARGA